MKGKKQREMVEERVGSKRRYFCGSFKQRKVIVIIRGKSLKEQFWGLGVGFSQRVEGNLQEFGVMLKRYRKKNMSYSIEVER